MMPALVGQHLVLYGGDIPLCLAGLHQRLPGYLQLADLRRMFVHIGLIRLRTDPVSIQGIDAGLVIDDFYPCGARRRREQATV